MSAVRLVSVLVCMSFVASCGPSQAEVDALERRLSTLEKRVRSLEGGGGGGMAAKGKAKSKQKARGGKVTPSDDKAQVDVVGEVEAVMLQDADEKWPVPAVVSAGEYRILASFEAGGAPVDAGAITVKASTPMRVVCAVSTRTCVGELAE
ncbi:MAG: hypothetical protein R3F61_16340 [Myxococcota bacterium]